MSLVPPSSPSPLSLSLSFSQLAKTATAGGGTSEGGGSGSELPADGITRDREWFKMDAETRELWAKLGWDEDNWEGDEDRDSLRYAEPWSERLLWEELDLDTRMIARSLGYTNGKAWDHDEGFGGDKGGAADDGDHGGFMSLSFFGLLLFVVGSFAFGASSSAKDRWEATRITAEERDQVKLWLETMLLRADKAPTTGAGATASAAPRTEGSTKCMPHDLLCDLAQFNLPIPSCSSGCVRRVPPPPT